jgi:hypothetical protein
MQKIFGVPKALVATVSQFTYLLASKAKMQKYERDLKEKATTLELEDF